MNPQIKDNILEQLNSFLGSSRWKRISRLDKNSSNNKQVDTNVFMDDTLIVPIEHPSELPPCEEIKRL